MTRLVLACALALTGPAAAQRSHVVIVTGLSGEPRFATTFRQIGTALYDAAATWGVGGQMFLGSLLRFAALFEHWATTKAIGTWDVGASFRYDNEPLFLSFAHPPGAAGATHRTVLAAQVGHTFHMGKRRSSALGIHVLGGWNYWRSDYTLDYPDEDVHGSAVVARHKAVVGAEVRFVQRLHAFPFGRGDIPGERR